MSDFNEIVLNKVCRACLMSSGDMKSLYEDCSSSTQIRLAEMLMSFAPLKCYENDRLPAQICENCISELNRFHCFQLKCLETDDILRNHLVKVDMSDVFIKDELIDVEENHIHPIIKQEIDYETENEIKIKNEPVEEIKANIANELLKDPLSDESILIESDTNDKKLLPHQIALEKITSTTKTCTICNSAFSLKEHLIKHIITSHGGKKPYWCIVCNKKFSRAGYLRVHMRNHNGEPHYKCQICRSLYKYKTSLLSHISKKHTPGIFACTNCDHPFKQDNLQCHIRQHSKQVHKCIYCDRLFTRNFELKVHMRTHTGEKPFSCRICDKAFHRKQILNRHMQAVHSLTIEGKEMAL